VDNDGTIISDAGQGDSGGADDLTPNTGTEAMCLLTSYNPEELDKSLTLLKKNNNKAMNNLKYSSSSSLVKYAVNYREMQQQQQYLIHQVQLNDDLGSLFGSSEECQATATSNKQLSPPTETTSNNPPSPLNNPPTGKIESLLAGSQPVGVTTLPDQVEIDSNGDGMADEFVIDRDGDGKIDQVEIDSNWDGKIDQVEVTIDSDGDGEIDQVATDSNGDGEIDQIATDSD
jgi:hypothetical protein